MRWVCLVRICNTGHTAHHTENVVVDGIDTHLGSGNTADSRRRKDKLENSVVNSGEVARSRRLVLLRAQGEGVDVDSSIRSTGVVLERLDNIEVRSFTLRETILAVQLKLSSDNRVLTPAVHIEGSLAKNECSGIRKTRGGSGSNSRAKWLVDRPSRSPDTRCRTESTGRSTDINTTGHLEKTRSSDEAV
jgi:hypothetical protein